MAGLYLHVPFCTAKCPYCDFYSQSGDDHAYDAYTAAVLRAMAAYDGKLTADTIYFGGGTPVLLGADRLRTLLKAAQKHFGLDQGEITIEANPCSVDTLFLRQLVDAGFNRISFGVQSLNDDTLRVLGRRHSAQRAEEMIAAANCAGFEHISADLMLAVPGQKLSDIDDAVERLSALPVDHISTYLLKLEEGTPFANRYAEPDEDFAADCYLKTVKCCESHGFMQYEISNFAKRPAAQSLHNLKYWQCEEYLGIGPAAHSFFNGRRFYFPRQLAAFIKAQDPWQLTIDDATGGSEPERLMLGLRLAKGIAFSDYSDRFCSRIRQKAIPLSKAGLLTVTEKGVALTTQGFLVSNSVICALL